MTAETDDFFFSSLPLKIDRPDITVMVDWALKINNLSIYLKIEELRRAPCLTSGNDNHVLTRTLPCNRCTYSEPSSSSLGLHRSGPLKNKTKYEQIIRSVHSITTSLCTSLQQKDSTAKIQHTKTIWFNDKEKEERLRFGSITLKNNTLSLSNNNFKNKSKFSFEKKKV